MKKLIILPLLIIGLQSLAQKPIVNTPVKYCNSEEGVPATDISRFNQLTNNDSTLNGYGDYCVQSGIHNPFEKDQKEWWDYEFSFKSFKDFKCYFCENKKLTYDKNMTLKEFEEHLKEWSLEWKEGAIKLYRNYKK